MSIYETMPRVNHNLPLALVHLVELIQTTDDPELIVQFHEEAEAAGEMFRDHIHTIVRFVNELNASQAAIKHEIARLQTLSDERAIRAERLETMVANWMATVGQRDIFYSDCTVRLKNNPPSVDVQDEERVPEVYWRTVVKETRSLDKIAIREAIKAGIDVDGCQLIPKTKLDIK